jgi:ATP-dependent Zn protease
MTQFSSEKESFGLVGLRKGFSDACEGYLTGFVKEHPKSILIFDEIEKSHNRVQTALLRMLSEGRLRDEFTGDDIDFRQTIVVFTSNLGSSLYSNRSFIKQTKQNPHQAREHLIHAIREEKKFEDGNQVSAIPPEMLSRLEQGSIILFNKLSVEGLSKIAKDKVLHEKTLFENKLGLTVNLPNLEKIVQLLVLSYAPVFDTRALKSRLTDQVYDPITDFLIADSFVELDTVEIQLDADAEKFLNDLNLETLAHQLATKHQRIYFNHRVFTADTTLHVVYENARIEKLPKGEDFKDASGIQVDLPDVSFEDIAGHEVIKGRLKEVITLISHREQLISQKVAPPKGMLLYGVPGTGKTMLAKAFAHEANLPFIACSGNDLLNESFIRSLFARAREYAPAIIFIDEIDALPRRGTSGPHADALVNRMLVEIDGFSGGDDSDIFIIAATNRKELIDPALLRSGRIDLHYEVPQLDKGARQWFIQKMLKGSMFSSSMDVEQLVLLTAGLSGADLQKINREAVIFALREGVEQISEEHLIEQINTLKYGAPLNLEDSKHRLEETAYHEAAHAVISQTLIPERRIEQITVIARSDFLGMVAYDSEQRHDYTKTFLFNLTCIALAGRAAQLKQFGTSGLDSGASGDLKQAAKYAWLAIAEWGMDDEMFNLSIPTIQNDLGSDAFRQLAEQQIKLWIDNATAQTKLLVDDYWEKIEAVAQQVLKDEIVSAATLKQLMESH